MKEFYSEISEIKIKKDLTDFYIKHNIVYEHIKKSILIEYINIKYNMKIDSSISISNIEEILLKFIKIG